MSFDISVLPVAVGVGASLLSAASVGLVKSASERSLAKLQEAARTRLSEIVATAYQTKRVSGPEGQVSSQLLKEVEQGILKSVSEREGLSREQVRNDVESRMTEVRTRLEAIEKRFPNDSTIDKVASINDALFAQRIEQLAASISQLEGKLLTKWDVALIVSIIVAGIFAVVGATYAVLKAFGHSP